MRVIVLPAAYFDTSVGNGIVVRDEIVDSECKYRLSGVRITETLRGK